MTTKYQVAPQQKGYQMKANFYIDLTTTMYDKHERECEQSKMLSSIYVWFKCIQTCQVDSRYSENFKNNRQLTFRKSISLYKINVETK